MRLSKNLILVVVMVAAVAILISAGLQSSIGQNMSIEQALAARDQGNDSGFIQIESNVDLQSIEYDPQRPILKFKLMDKNQSISVMFKDVKPDNFDSGYPVIVEGRFDVEGVFQADKLLVKCPSKYEEEEVAPGAAPGANQEQSGK